MYSQAQAEIHNLMNRDNFDRFKATEEFKTFLESLGTYSVEGSVAANAKKRVSRAASRQSVLSSSPRPSSPRPPPTALRE